MCIRDRCKILFHILDFLVDTFINRKRRNGITVHRFRRFSGAIIFTGYLLNGWFELFPDGLAMVSRMEVSASMFFIR